MPRTRLAAIALIAVTAIWGAAFVVMDPAISRFPIFGFLAVRFALATVIMVAVRPRVLRRLSRPMLGHGAILGSALGTAYITQTIGLFFSTAAVTGFVTGLYVAFTPLLCWVLFRMRVSRRVVAGVALAVIGLSVLGVGSLKFGWGEVALLANALLFAVHIVGLGRWSDRYDAYALTIVQLATCTVLMTAGALVFDGGLRLPDDAEIWFAVCFTAIGATALAFFVQTWAQAFIEPSRAAIILTTEVVFTAAISWGVGQEKPTLPVVAGGAIILAAMLVIEWPSRSRSDQGPVPLEPFAH